MMVFAASTYNKDESPHLALVSWVNFYWDDGLGVTLCMDGDKAVKRNFEREGALVRSWPLRQSLIRRHQRQTPCDLGW